MTFGWLVGRQIAGQRRTQEKEPIAFSYNGAHLPLLKAYDQKKYPYLFLQFSWFGSTTKAYATSEPIVQSGGFGSPVPTPAIKCTLSYYQGSEYMYKEQWTEWEAVQEGENCGIADYFWANYDIKKSDGTIYLPACADPVPVYLPELLFDGEVTTEYVEYQGNVEVIDLLNAFSVGDSLQITVDGTTEIHTVKSAEPTYAEYIGNETLTSHADDDAVDTGEDWCLLHGYDISDRDAHGFSTGRFFTRNPGTYTVKVERLST